MFGCQSAISLLNKVDLKTEQSSSDEGHSASISPGSVNEYQLRLERQRQVWFILLADERGVCR